MASKQDYEAIAAIISDTRGRRQEGRLSCILRIQTGIAEYFSQDNPNFDVDQFNRACMAKENASG